MNCTYIIENIQLIARYSNAIQVNQCDGFPFNDFVLILIFIDKVMTTLEVLNFSTFPNLSNHAKRSKMWAKRNCLCHDFPSLLVLLTEKRCNTRYGRKM